MLTHFCFDFCPPEMAVPLCPAPEPQPLSPVCSCGLPGAREDTRAFFSLHKRRLWGSFITVCNYLMGKVTEDGARQRCTGTGQEATDKFNIKSSIWIMFFYLFIFYNEDSQVFEQTAQRGCNVSILEQLSPVGPGQVVGAIDHHKPLPV